MSIADLLSSFLTAGAGSNVGFGQTAGAIDPGQSAAPGGQTSTPISELAVTAARKPPNPSATMVAPQTNDQALMAPPASFTPDTGASQVGAPPDIDYNNSQSVQAVRAANMANQPQPGGMTSPGLYGLLPANLQHGTLRDVLGNLGDAISGGGSTAKYAQMMERQQIGDAMAGMDPNNPDSVQAAVQRIAATGAPGALDVAQKVQQNDTEMQLRKATLDSTNWYRESMANNRTDTRLQAIVPSLGGVLANVKDSASYGPAYDQIAKRIQRIDPNAKPEDLGLPARDGWTPGSTDGYGTTGNAQMVSADKGAQRDVSTQNNIRTNNTNLRRSGIQAGATEYAARTNAGSRGPTPGQEQEALSARMDQADSGGPPLTQGEKARIQKLFGVPRSQRPVLTPAAQSTNPGTNAGSYGANALRGGDNVPTVTPQQAARLPSGTRFRTTDGRILVRH